MDFFEAQDHARRQTFVLVGLFVAAVISIVIGVYLVLLLAGGMGMGVNFGFDPILFGVVAIGTLGLIAGGSATRTAQLRKGGSAVAELLGARPVDPATRNEGERRLVNVVEEMSLASGTPVPAIYVLENEPGINAFAAGYSIHDAAVAVTRGTLDQLNREELQGVVAHEFSHILNGDMRLNIRLVGLLFGILLLAVVGRGLLRGQMVRRRRSNSKGLFLGLALIVLGYVGVFFGKLIKAAVSRQREFLADAAAVEFTRNPRGIGGALRKIADSQAGSRIQDHHAEELSHLFFADGVGGALARSMATHPPIEERIRRLDPDLAAANRTDSSRTPGPPASPANGTAVQAGASGFAGSPGARPVPGGGGEGSAASGGTHSGPGLQAGAGVAAAANLMASVGTPCKEHMEWVEGLMEEIPSQIRDAAHEPAGAQAILLSLLGGRNDESDEIRRTVAAELGSEVERSLEVLGPLLLDLPPEARLPVVDLSLPALHGLTVEQADGFRRSVDRVIRADGELRVFDFAVTHVLWRHLPGRGDRVRRRHSGSSSLGSFRNELQMLLSAFARGSGADEDGTQAAFREGLRSLGKEGSTLTLLPTHATGLTELDHALDRLERAKLEVRKKVLEACAAAVLHDGRARTQEIELLRAVAESLELPLPPLVASDPRA